MSLETAIKNQERKLGERLKSGDTLSGKWIDIVIQNIGFNLDEESKQLLQRFCMLLRLIDNLIDEEGVSGKDLALQVSEKSEILYMQDFIQKLKNEDQKENFIHMGRRAIKVMERYNQTKNNTFRLLEGRLLGELFLTVIDPQKTSHRDKRKALKHFLIGSYMFCDLKDFLKDEREWEDVFEIFIRLIEHSFLSFMKAENKIGLFKASIKMSYISILSSLK